MHFVFFILSGKELHTAGAAYVRALVPSVSVLVIGSFSCVLHVACCALHIVCYMLHVASSYLHV